MDAGFMIWVWVVAAAFFLVVEIFTVSFFISCFGVGAIGAAIVAAFAPGAYTTQMAVFVVVTAITVALTRRFADRVSGKQAEDFGVDRLRGQSGVVVQAIDPVTGAGRVRVAREEWRADSAMMDPIEVGATIEVIEIEGTHLVVRRHAQT
jgi:membrane protein implicated in regulation of membrane protease activity